MRSRVYTLTHDRPRNNDYGLVVRRLQKLGFVVRLSTKTTFMVELFPGTKFQDLKRTLIAVMDRAHGTVVVVSSRTGNVFQMNNKGNRPCEFVRVES